jgi:hypothetical protein
VIASMRDDVVRTFGDHHPFDFGVGLVERDSPLKVFRWSGSYVDTSFLVQRLVLVAIAVALAVLGALWFHRFDPARAMPRRRAAAHPAEAATRWEFPVRRPATAARSGPAGFRLVRTSLRVLLAGVSRWWWAGALLLSLIAAVAPARTIAPALLPLCWVWPVLLWSRLGTQEIDVLAAYPHRRTQILATWLAGVLLTAVTGAVPLVRLLSSGETRGVAAWFAGALFIPALAYLVGSLTRSSRPFQILYLLWWYAILNGGNPINFMAAVGPNPALVATAALALFFLTTAWQEVRHARR